ncbi:MAG TPA: TMEM175 family protein [Chitinophagaceae bacterium]|nr:TMEM175 family protein [Chitinophagaceae bacterium]
MKSIRLEALGDGIFSIAMTIMVIELALPAVKGNSWNDFLSALKFIGSDFLCYVISFVVLGIMWYGHRMMFEYIGRTNRYFIFLGVLFYMVICLVPFSTRMLSHETLKWYAILIYAINLSLCNLSLYAQWTYGINKPSLLERELPGEVRKEARVLFLISPVVYSIAIAFSFFIPEVSIGIFILTPLLYLIPNKLDKYLP